MKLSHSQRKRLRRNGWKYYPELQRWVKVWNGQHGEDSVYILDRNQYIPVPGWSHLAKDITDFYQHD